MTDYILLRIDCDPCTPDITDLAADALLEAGFDSFSPDDAGLDAYIRADLYDPTTAARALDDFPIPTSFTLSETIVKGRDWNEEWEKNYFQPITVTAAGHRCTVRSSFHPEDPGADIQILIDPKMAFGTGHHATTSQMMTLLLDTNLKGKSMIDVGTGTGILSILAQKAGASPVTGIEIDPDAADNARDNIKLNDSQAVILTGDASCLADLQPADIVAANINRNIILADIDRYASRLKPGGHLLLSGFYTSDIPLIDRAANALGLQIVETRSDQDWAALRYRSQSTNIV